MSARLLSAHSVTSLDVVHCADWRVLFARNSAPGWDAWGNEAPNCIDWRPVMRSEVAA